MIIDQLKQLLEESVDINGIGNNGISPLDTALGGESEEIIKYLLILGAKENLNLYDDFH